MAVAQAWSIPGSILFALVYTMTTTTGIFFNHTQGTLVSNGFLLSVFWIDAIFMAIFLGWWLVQYVYCAMSHEFHHKTRQKIRKWLRMKHETENKFKRNASTLVLPIRKLTTAVLHRSTIPRPNSTINANDLAQTIEVNISHRQPSTGLQNGHINDIRQRRNLGRSRADQLSSGSSTLSLDEPEVHSGSHMDWLHLDAYNLFCILTLGAATAIYFGLATYIQFKAWCPHIFLNKRGAIFMFVFVVVQTILVCDPLHAIQTVLVKHQGKTYTPAMMRFSLAYFIGTHVTLWFYATQTKAIEDYCTVYKHNFYRETNATIVAPEMCNNTLPFCGPNISDINGYLLPIIGEFCLFTIEIMITWYRMTMTTSEESTTVGVSVFGGAKVGILFGAAIMTVEIASFLIYAKTGMKMHAELIDIGLGVISFLVNIALIIIIHQRAKDRREEKTEFEEIVYIVVLLFTYIGLFLYCLVDFMATSATISINGTAEKYMIVLAVADVIRVVDGTSQILVMFQTTTKDMDTALLRSPAIRNLLVYQFFHNICFWFANSYRYVKSKRNIRALQYLEGHTWIIVTHMTVPLIIYFHFHLATIYYHLTKVAVPNPSATPRHASPRDTSSSGPVSSVGMPSPRKMATIFGSGNNVQELRVEIPDIRTDANVVTFYNASETTSDDQVFQEDDVEHQPTPSRTHSF